MTLLDGEFQERWKQAETVNCVGGLKRASSDQGGVECLPVSSCPGRSLSPKPHRTPSPAHHELTAESHASGTRRPKQRKSAAPSGAIRRLAACYWAPTSLTCILAAFEKPRYGVLFGLIRLCTVAMSLSRLRRSCQSPSPIRNNKTCSRE
jgi:hypothetical protein